MYQRLSDNKTKLHYKAILNETIAMAKQQKENAPSPVWESILNQLLDIKEKIVDKKLDWDWEYIDDRYTLGALAVQFFDEGEEMQKRLFDVFGGAIDYSSYPEK